LDWSLIDEMEGYDKGGMINKLDWNLALHLHFWKKQVQGKNHVGTLFSRGL
jgi:hypothetical protein